MESKAPLTNELNFIQDGGDNNTLCVGITNMYVGIAIMASTLYSSVLSDLMSDSPLYYMTQSQRIFGSILCVVLKNTLESTLFDNDQISQKQQ